MLYEVITVVLRSLIDEYCNFVQVIDEAEGVEDGFAKINKYKPDLVFLDVQMGDGTGFDLLKKFSHIDFKIIFVTTHEGFAIEAIKYAALDYLFVITSYSIHYTKLYDFW